MALRSEESRRAILDAALKLLDEDRADGLTVQKLSIERIAREAGVGKTTIYRWWPSKAAVVIDSFVDSHIAATPVRSGVPAIEALREHLASLAEIYSGREGRLVAQLIAECQYDASTLAEFKERFWSQRQLVVSELIERSMEEGSIDCGLDPEVIAEMLYSPIYFRLLFQVGSLDKDVSNAIFDTAMRGLRDGASKH